MNERYLRSWIACAVVCAIVGCGDEPQGSGGGGAASTTSSTSTNTGSGGGGASPCIDAAAFAQLFAIADDGFCAVAVYTADVALGFQVPTWGAHGGPLLSEGDGAGGVTITRWKAPSGAPSALTKQTSNVAAMIPDGAFVGAQALDVPFFGWTALSWSGAFPDTQGKILAVKGAAIDRSYDVNGAFALAAVGDATSGRLLYTGLSPIGDASIAMNGLYVADACDTPSPDLGAGQGCEAPKLVAAWGDSSGPVAVDRDGNAFSVMPSFATGDQEARGFAAAEIARGAKAASGASLFTMPGFGSALAAISPRDARPGVLVFQPYDASAKPLDVIAQRYTSGAAINAQGATTPLLTISKDTSPPLALMTDDQGRLWVASSDTSTTTFVVLDRAP